MIFYIASYPRSGNMWVRSLITNQFKKMGTTLHKPERNGEKFEAWATTAKNMFGIHIEKLSPEQRVKVCPIVSLRDWIVAYDFEGGKTLDHLSLAAGFIGVYSNEVRQFLAEDKEIYFIKTHLLPYDMYFPQEYVIQITRHPGATLWSYYNFFNQVKEKSASLMEVIAGEHGFGDWSLYHEKWNQSADLLGERIFRVKYEDLHTSEIDFVMKLENFLGLPIVDSHIKPFSYYQSIRPKVTRSGQVSEWIQNYTQDATDLLVQRHGKMMEYFSYRMPS